MLKEHDERVGPGRQQIKFCHMLQKVDEAWEDSKNARMRP
jgi:hypothetical protein